MADWIRSLIDDDGTVASRGALAQLETLEADAERARVVGVLDAFVRRHALIVEHAVRFGTSGGQAMFMCEFRDTNGQVLEWLGGDDEDSARAGAAEAIERGDLR